MPLARSVESIREGTRLGLYFSEKTQLWYTDGKQRTHKDLLEASGFRLTDQTIAFELYRNGRNFRITPCPSSSADIPKRDVQPVKEHLLGLPRNDKIEVTIFDDNELQRLIQEYGR